MRKNAGITRSKYEQLQESKSKLHRKKSRFHSSNKNDESFETCTHVINMSDAEFDNRTWLYGHQCNTRGTIGQCVQGGLR